MGRACSTNGVKTACRIWVGKARRKVTIRKTKRHVDNIKMDLREIGWDGIDWSDLAQDRDQ
jgi:hypothetical protein